ncbi:MAG TPA: NAD(P)H-dependent oxidoreductase [bacterium]|jgi:FMN-dependent NADH-azoreductase|nr:NAD(P)H-dependent oxidoreductase [bacterium]
MKQLLLINASPRGSQSVSRSLSSHLVERLRASEGPLEVKERDLTTTELPFLSQDLIQAYYTPLDKRSDEQRSLLRVSDSLVDELAAADILIIAAPVWNFALPAQVKAWIDLVARAGRTFSYTAEGPRGLLQNRPVYVIKSSGGVFSEGPGKAMDFYEGYLGSVLRFMGLTDLTFIRAEGLSLPGQAQTRIEDARKQIETALHPALAAI